MLKREVLALIAVIASASAFGQNTATAPASQLSGTATLGIGDKNVLGSPYYASVPDVSSSFTSANIALKFTDGSGLSFIDKTLYKDSVNYSLRMGYEAGIALDAANLYSFNSQTSKSSGSGASSYYSVLQPMIDWYENNWRRFGMAASPFGSGVWPTTSYGSSTTRTRFIYGRTVEPIEYVKWTSVKWGDAAKLYADIVYAIDAAIESISSDVSAGKADQFIFEGLATDRKKKAMAEMKAYADFHAVSDGSDRKASWTGPNLQAAYLKLTNVFGVMDVRADFLGAKLYADGLVSSSRSDQPASGPALTFSLPVGLVPGFSLSLAADVVGGSSSVVENYDTNTTEYYSGEASWIGLKLKTGYSMGDDWAVSLSMLFPDIVARPLTMTGTLAGKYSRVGPLSALVSAEADFLTWQDRYVSTVPLEFAFAAGADASVTYLGFTPHLIGRFKTAGYFGTNGNLVEDRFAGLDLLGDFNSVKVKGAMAINGGLKFDPVLFIGYSLASIDFGYQMLMYNFASPVALGQGWYAGANCSLQDLVRVPLSFTFSVNSYENLGQYTYSDFAKAPTDGLLSDLTWNFLATYQFSSDASVSFEASCRDSAWLYDTNPILSLGLKSSIRF